MAKIDRTDISKLDLNDCRDVLLANMVLDNNLNWYLEKLDLADDNSKPLGGFASKEEFEEVRDIFLKLQDFYLPEHEKYASYLNSLNYAISGIASALIEISSS